MHFERSPYPTLFSRVCSIIGRVFVVVVFAGAIYLITTSLIVAVQAQRMGAVECQNSDSTRR